ncbi:unnamed protein product [Aureobasidium uvarum]|uniref:Uncharacterized protein n=1 Tax=Aureobasidium uvarum TaxID=2773716 RepID=A0A9N8KTS9_9PEZI|nr:unnamed protein product [Aureobasidium uvarum]
MTTDPPSPINLEITKGPKRPGFSRRKDHPDEQYYITLYPGVDFKIQHSIERTARESELSIFQAGHKYRLGISGEEKIPRWWWGTRDEVLSDSEHIKEGVGPAQGEVAIVIYADPVDFDVMNA